VLKQTDKSDHAEGLYLKVEDEEQVLARYKLVRHDLRNHPRQRFAPQHAPLIPNQLGRRRGPVRAAAPRHVGQPGPAHLPFAR
jgi:hypothetical protein